MFLNFRIFATHLALIVSKQEFGVRTYRENDTLERVYAECWRTPSIFLKVS